MQELSKFFIRALHNTSPRQHKRLPAKATGKRYTTNHGISSRQRCRMAELRGSRAARSTSLMREFQS